MLALEEHASHRRPTCHCRSCALTTRSVTTAKHAQSTPVTSALAVLTLPFPAAPFAAMASATLEKIPIIVHQTVLALTTPLDGTIATGQPSIALGMDLEVPTVRSTVTATQGLGLPPMKLAVSAEEAALCLAVLRHRRRLRHLRLATPAPVRMEGSAPILVRATSATAPAPDILALPVRLISTNVLRALTTAAPMLVVPTRSEATPAPVTRDTLETASPAPRLNAAPTKRL